MSEPQWQTCPKCGERWWDSHVCRNTLNSLTVALAPTCRFCGQAARAQPAQAGQGTKVKEPHFAPQEAITEDGWTEWVCPKPKGYLAQCCDCGLVHEIDTRVAKYEPRPSENFEVVTDPDLQVQWRVRRRDDLRQEIREIPAFEPDQTPDLEAGKSRFYSAQAGQVLTLDEVRESVHEAGLDWHNGWTMGEDAENRYLNLCRAVEQSVLAKRVPQWLPIETAPKDEAVLGYWPDGYYERVVMSDDGECEVYHILHDGEQRADNPSHWMPLPPPPGIVGEKGGAWASMRPGIDPAAHGIDAAIAAGKGEG